MINNLIRTYIDKLTIESLEDVLVKNNVPIDEEDTIIIYQYLKDNKENIIKNDIFDTLKELKGLLKDDSFKELYRLYLDYEPQILNWDNTKKNN